MREICGNCKHYMRVIDEYSQWEWCCGDNESNNYAVPMLYNDSCENWEDNRDD